MHEVCKSACNNLSDLMPAQCTSALSLPAYADISSPSSAIGTFNPILWAASCNRSIISQPKRHP